MHKLTRFFCLQADARLVDDVRRASSSFVSSGGPSTVFPLAGKSQGDDFKVLDENLLDVLLFLGILIDDAKLGEIKTDQKIFLNLTGDGVYSLPVRLYLSRWKLVDLTFRLFVTQELVLIAFVAKS